MPDLKLNIDDKFDKSLTELVADNSDAKNKGDVIQRAVATYQYLRTGIPKGSKIQVTGPTGEVLDADLQIP